MVLYAWIPRESLDLMSRKQIMQNKAKVYGLKVQQATRLRFRVLRFSALSLGFRVQCLGFRVWVLGGRAVKV